MSTAAIGSFVWVHLSNSTKSHPVEIYIGDCRNISQLIKLIKAELSPKLDNVSIDQINLYSSNDNNATALRPGLNLSTLFTQPNVAGTTYDTPLYIKVEEGVFTSLDKGLLYFSFCCCSKFDPFFDFLIIRLCVYVVN
jgi:hypothetical protein